MSSSDLKKQILRQAVADNVAIRERRLKTRAPRVLARPSGRRGALLLVLPALVLVAVYALRQLPAARLEATPVPAPAADAARPAAEAPADPVFAAPRPIDSGVFSLAVRRIVIDPGHGGEDYGTVDHRLTEKSLTLDIALRLAEQLEADGFEVVLTRRDDRALSLKERAELANRAHADLFVSIHINWISARHVRGIETYYLGTTEDPELNALARRENQRSGYSLADMKMLLEGIYTGVRQDQSRHLADRVQRALYSSLRTVNPKLENRGVKTAPFMVLVSTDMPAILAEVSCLSNDREAELLARPRYREHIAEALSKGIGKYAADVHQIEEKGS